VDPLDRFRLDGRVAVVTGASSGLGVGIAEALAAAGADVALGARSADGLATTKRLVEELGQRAVAVSTDVTSVSDCHRLVATAREVLGRVDVLVNNAGVAHTEPAHREDPLWFDKVIGVNLVGAWHMAQAFAQACIAEQHGGSIINISSVLGIRGSHTPQAAYSASKAGLLGLTRDLAMQWSGRRGIRVNALAPGYFATEMTEALTTSPVAMQQALAQVPLDRLGEVSELAAPLLLLASDAGSYITGVTLAVDGGWSMH
jgi:NAD(P)-dependent dehydrogenase (short-subunit alcohol dehydrogenase family)